MSIVLETERQFFDALAARTVVTPMTADQRERYRQPRRPHLFAKEMMFALANPLAGKRVLEIGCGQGEASVQLASCGAVVTAMDLSPVSLEVARRRAAVNGVSVDFVECDITDPKTDWGEACFDVVWCDCILHHVIDSLDGVLARAARALKPGGRFIAREPLAYPAWLKWLRRRLPVPEVATPDEQPLRSWDVALMRGHFPELRQREYRLLARIDRLTPRLRVIALAAWLDNMLWPIPGIRSLAGTAVFWADQIGIGS